MTGAPVRSVFSTTIEALRLRGWQLGPGQPTLDTDQFSAEDFDLIVDDRADVDVSSMVGRFYLGWSPLDCPGSDDEGRENAVASTAEVGGYYLFFDTETSADIVAVAVARVLETAWRV
ncbi:DUF317 domain-containing protein [Streptomyces hebeiensis]|uniref:DUF317 domain-containing protein n=1 Tax=Streptomyces hebeiensis TaxID=229486 RepID=A0ABN1UQG9_9ACTN